MENDFPTAGVELTQLLVVSDIEKSKWFYSNVLGAKVYREHAGTSCVLNFQSSWILLVTSGEPTEDKPDVTFSTPADPNLADHKFEPGRVHSLNPTIKNNYELAIRI